MSEREQNTQAMDEVPSANGWFQLTVANGGITASVKKIVRHTGKGKPVKTADILKKLKELKVIYGIDQDAIEALIKSVDENNVPEDPVIIAKGDIEHGENGTIEWFVEGITETETSFLVIPNMPIAKRALPTQGKKGKNVYGKPVNPRPGFDQPLEAGPGINDKQESEGIIIYETSHAGILSYQDRTLGVNNCFLVNETGLQAHMDIHIGKVCNMDKTITVEDVLRSLEATGIKHGIKTENIEQALTNARLEKIDCLKHVLVAEGDAPINGEDDTLEWHLSIKSEQINQRAVIPEQKIVTVLSNTEPKPGMDIYGNVVEGEKGAEIIFDCGRGIIKEKTTQGYEYSASCLGIAHLDENTLTVKSGVKVSKDKMEARMSLLRPDISDNNGDILLSHVVKTLNEHNIVYGIKTEPIRLILESINKNKDSKLDLLVAQGKPCIDGSNARVEYSQELAKEGKLLPDGRIDFHEKSYPWNVKVDDVIGKLIPARHAEDGINVYGEEILANVINEAEPILEGVTREENGDLRVTEAGVLLVNGVNFKVSDTLELDGDLGAKTGNIHCDKTVNVRGYVEPGFILETKGDAIIQANVEDAVVNSGGNIIIKSGIRGTHSKINCEGDLSASFAENAERNAKGDIHIKNNIINCHSVCHGVMRVGDKHSKKSGLVGNITHAYRSIESSVLGSDSFNQTIVIAGAGIETMKEMMDKAEELKKMKLTATDLDRVYKHYCKHPKPQQEQNALLLKLEETRDMNNGKLSELNREHDILKQLVEQSKQARVFITKRVYPGVKIFISNKNYEVKEEHGPGVFLLSGEKIIFEPT